MRGKNRSRRSPIAKVFARLTVALAFLFAANASGQALQLTLVDVVDSSGDRFFGHFDFNVVLGTYGWSIITVTTPDGEESFSSDGFEPDKPWWSTWSSAVHHQPLQLAFACPFGARCGGPDLFSLATVALIDPLLTNGDSYYSTDHIPIVSGYAVETATPLPTALPLFVASLGGLAVLSRRRKRKAAAAKRTCGDAGAQEHDHRPARLVM